MRNILFSLSNIDKYFYWGVVFLLNMRWKISYYILMNNFMNRNNNYELYFIVIY